MNWYIQKSSALRKKKNLKSQSNFWVTGAGNNSQICFFSCSVLPSSYFFSRVTLNIPKYITDTYDTLVAEAETTGEKMNLKIEELKALTEFKAAAEKQGNFECDCLVRVTEMEVY